VGQGSQNTGSVSGVFVATNGTPVRHVYEHGFGLINDLVASAPFDIGYEAYAAGIVLKVGVIKALLGRSLSIAHVFSPETSVL
jgi:hypothetical protein